MTPILTSRRTTDRPFNPRLWILVSLTGLVGCSDLATGQKHSGRSAAKAACCETEPEGSTAGSAGSESGLTELSTSPWLSPSERTRSFPLAYKMSRQEGKKVTETDLFGRPFVVTFIYTRCENLNKCPLVASTLGRLQTVLGEQGLDQSVTVLLFTYDPENDSPQRLKEFSQRHQLQANARTWLLRPDPGEKREFFRALNVAVNFNQNDVNAHRIELMLFDARGRFVRSYHSLIWDNNVVARDLARLVAEH